MMNPMQGNPMMQLMQMMRGGMNPMQVLQGMAQSQNPQVMNAMKMINGKNPQQLKTMCENMCKQRGFSIEQAAQSLGLQIPQK